MTLNPKIWALAVTLGGGGITLPFCLSNINKRTALAPQKPVQPTDTNSVSEAKPVEKVACEATDISPSSEHLKNFLTKNQKDSSLYSYVSCKNTVVAGDDTSLLDKDLMGLFPKNSLDATFSPETGQKFEMNIETIRDEGQEGTVMKIVFENPKTKSSLRGRFGSISETDFQKRSIAVSIEGSRLSPKEIYLFVVAPSEESSE